MRSRKPREWRHPKSGKLYFRVRFTDTAGKERAKTFETAEAGQDFIADLAKVAKQHGKLGVTNSEETAGLALWREFVRDELEAGREPPRLDNVIRDAVKALRSGAETPTLWALNRDFMRASKASGASVRHLETLTYRLERAEGFLDPSRRAGEFTTLDIEKALNALRRVPLSAQTVKGIRATLRSSFQWGADRDIVPSNPVSKASKPKVGKGEVGIISASKFKGLLKSAMREDPASVVPLAIWGFCGVRRAELCRLTWDDVDIEGGDVKVSAAKAKTGTTRFVPITSSCKAWIEAVIEAGVLPVGKLLPGESERESEFQLRKWLDASREGAGITEWPNNALRHSFASSACAATENYQQVAAWLGHGGGDTRLLEQRYRSALRKKEGEAWFNVFPENKAKAKAKTKAARRRKAS